MGLDSGFKFQCQAFAGARHAGHKRDRTPPARVARSAGHKAVVLGEAPFQIAGYAAIKAAIAATQQIHMPDQSENPPASQTVSKNEKSQLPSLQSQILKTSPVIIRLVACTLPRTPKST